MVISSVKNVICNLGVGDKPDALIAFIAIQHVCAMIVATILVSIVVNTAVGAVYYQSL